MNTNSFPHRTLKWKGHRISLHRWGPSGMWGVDESNILGKTFFGPLEPYCIQTKQGYSFWAITITNAKPKHWPTGEYLYYKTEQELVKAHPDGIRFEGGGHLVSLAQVLRSQLNESIISHSPIDQ